MNAEMYKSLQRRWARKKHTVDKKGLAVALIFLAAMFVGIRACRDNTTEQVSNAFKEQPALSADVEIRSAGKSPRERELDDRRQPQ